MGAGITTSGLGDQDYGFRGRVSDLEVHGYMFGVASYGFRVRGYLLRLKGSGLGVKCSRFRVSISRIGALGFGVRFSALWFQSKGFSVIVKIGYHA